MPRRSSSRLNNSPSQLTNSAGKAQSGQKMYSNKGKPTELYPVSNAMMRQNSFSRQKKLAFCPCESPPSTSPSVGSIRSKYALPPSAYFHDCQQARKRLSIPWARDRESTRYPDWAFSKNFRPPRSDRRRSRHLQGGSCSAA